MDSSSKNKGVSSISETSSKRKVKQQVRVRVRKPANAQVEAKVQEIPAKQ